ncbi:fasciclin domain-containing protein [Yeosuana marina]|uniref:fasciclin domain-containing protein n=1 Tax=Yeosuana marina TaxID=1565536 RepID=UPI0030C842A4
MNIRIDTLKNMIKAFYLLKSGFNVLLISILVLANLSCNSNDMESVVEASTSQPNDVLQISESISEIIFQNGFQEFSQALQYVNDELYTALVEIFATGTDPHTVFIPTDEAFYKLYDCLGMKTRDISEINNPGLVRDILLYHLVRERYTLDGLIQSNQDIKIKTYYGESLTIKSDGSINSIVNSSFIDVNQSNKFASNGIVHVITDVLLPIDIPCTDEDE